jgi:hypothetical protein
LQRDAGGLLVALGLLFTGFFERSGRIRVIGFTRVRDPILYLPSSSV